jgi:chaperonin GroES
MSTNFKPLGNNLVWRLGTVIAHGPGQRAPETARKAAAGKVLAVGPAAGWRRLAAGEWSGVGDKVLYGKYSGTQIKVGDKELLILSEDDVLAIVL